MSERADRPIIFSGPMVRALLDGRKTQTRRVLKPQLPENPTSISGKRWGRVDGALWYCGVKLPYAPGDRLWVRESWRAELAFDWTKPCDIPVGKPIYYEAADDEPTPECAGKLHPAIHMPRWASRLTLVVTDVRVQRVREISRADAIAEGIYKSEPTADDLEWYREWAPEHGIDPAKEPMEGVWMAPGTRQGWGMTKAERDKEQWAPDPEFGFKLLWNTINAKRGYGWDANPWVVALTFAVDKRNIDSLEAA